MAEDKDHSELDNPEHAPRYMIRVAAARVGMHQQTLRVYEQRGLIQPARTPGNTRLYSDKDLERLRLIGSLTSEMGLNLAGVELVMQLRDEIDRLHQVIDSLSQQRGVSKGKELVLFRSEVHVARKTSRVRG